MKKIFLVTSLFLLISGGSVLAYNYYLKPDEVKIKTVHGTTMADFSDKRNIVGFSDYVFIGEVVKELGQENWHLPVSKFTVKVNEQIKGEIAEEQIVVYQYGGYDEEDKEHKTIILFENNPLLQVNKTYVFSAKKQEDGKILLVPVNGHAMVDEANDIDKLRSEFKEAFKNQTIIKDPQKD